MKSGPKPTLGLTRRQRECALLAAQGLLRKQICDELDTVLGTVDVHIKRSLQKLNVNGRVELAHYFLATGELENLFDKQGKRVVKKLK